MDVKKFLIGFMVLVFVISFGVFGFAEEKQNLSKKQVEYIEVKTIPLYETFKTKEKWHVTAYDIKDVDQLNEYCGKYPNNCRDENNRVPAMKLCFWHNSAKKDQFCHRVGDDKYTYETTKDIKIVKLCDHCKFMYGLLLHAENHGFDVGWLSSVSIWVFHTKGKKFTNILPIFRFTEQGEYKIISVLEGTKEVIAVKADEIVEWQEEGRYGTHRYAISIYMLEDDGYRFIGEYKTKSKYESPINDNTVDIIEHEIGKIKNYILNKSNK